MNLDYKHTHSQFTHKGNVRAENEDSHSTILTLNGRIFILCDGMGGAVGGKKASELAVKSIAEYFNRTKYENKGEAIIKAIDFANEQIYATSLAIPELKGMGTTCCVLLIDGDEIYYGHVGDSRIYLLIDSNLFHLTRDHSHVMKLVEKKEITIKEARTHPLRSRILQALGTSEKVIPSVVKESPKLKKGSTILICSDGLNDMIDDYSIKHILTGTDTSLDDKSQQLINGALENGGKDNITVQLIEITESPFTKTVFVDKTPRDAGNEIALNSTITLDENKTGTKSTFFSKNKNSLIALGAAVSFFLCVGILYNFYFKKDNVGGEEKTEESSSEEETSTEKADSLLKTKGSKNTEFGELQSKEATVIRDNKEGSARNKINKSKDKEIDVAPKPKPKPQPQSQSQQMSKVNTKKSIPECKCHYVEKKGETLYSIGVIYGGIGIVNLRNFNNLSSNKITPGDTIYLVKGAREMALKKEKAKKEFLKTNEAKTEVPKNKIPKEETNNPKIPTEVPDKKELQKDKETNSEVLDKRPIKCIKKINEVKKEYPDDWRDRVKCAENILENKGKITGKIKRKNKEDEYLELNGDKDIIFCKCLDENK